MGEISELDEIGKAPTIRNLSATNKKRVNGITANPFILLVPRDGIEPPTRGFQIPFTRSPGGHKIYIDVSDLDSFIQKNKRVYD